jgi:hypothetical protein
MSSVFEKWRASRGAVEGVWQKVWEWAEKKASPLARYHASSLFSQHPNLVPPDAFIRLWDEILGAVFDSKMQSSDSPWREEWLLRLALAQHYLKYFLSQRPGRNEEGIACFSWWLTEQVSLAFAGKPEFIAGVRDSGLKVALRNSDLAWQTSTGSLGSSSLVYVTLNTPSVWSLSLECALGKNLRPLKFETLSDEKQLHFARAAAGSLYSWFPVRSSPDEPATFAFDLGAEETCRKLAEAERDPNKAEAARALVAGISPVEGDAAILLGLRKLLELDEATRILILFAFRARSYLYAVPSEEVLKILTDGNWCRDLLMRLEEGPLQVFFDAVNTLQLKDGDLWTCTVPHLFALAAEAAHEDRDRQKLLFLFTILSSIRGSTTSAIERLMCGEKKGDFVNDVKFCREQFGKIMQISPPWAAARIRPALASLSLV